MPYRIVSPHDRFKMPTQDPEVPTFDELTTVNVREREPAKVQQAYLATFPALIFLPA